MEILRQKLSAPEKGRLKTIESWPLLYCKIRIQLTSRKTWLGKRRYKRTISPKLRVIKGMVLISNQTWARRLSAQCEANNYECLIPWHTQPAWVTNCTRQKWEQGREPEGQAQTITGLSALHVVEGQLWRLVNYTICLWYRAVILH